MIPFSIIVAIDKNFGIGRNGKIPWHLSCDLRHFKKITTQNPSSDKKKIVIMGRKTWESIEDKHKPLCGRINIVISHNKELKLSKDVLLVDKLNSAFEWIENKFKGKSFEVFVIGGAQVFFQALSLSGCRKLYVTHILEDFECDTFFPGDLASFEQISQSTLKKSGSISYFFAEYVNI